MHRLFIGLVAALLASAAPAPKDAESDYFYPTQKGATWVYQRENDETVRTVTDVDNTGDGAKLVSCGFKDTEGKTVIVVILVSKEGLYEQSCRQPPDSRGTCLLKLPHRDGATWDMEDFPSTNLKVTHRMTAFGPEEVEVPAGKYEAIRVVGEYKLNDTVFKGTHWYVRGIGIVKSEVAGEVVLTLKSFTRGNSR